VAQKVQEAISKTMQAGASDVPPSKVISEITGWSRAYADTVYRTNLCGAYSAGRLRQAMDPDVEDVVVGLRYVAAMDSNTRPNHAAAHGLVAAHDDPIWYDLAPPAGYACRCSLELVDRFTAEREGLLVDGKLPRAQKPPGAGRDNKFPGRVDLPEKQRRRGEFKSSRPDRAMAQEGLTVPTRRPNPEARAYGPPKAPPAGASPEIKRETTRQNECATILAKNGYEVRHLPDAPGAPDLLVGMHLWNAYAPVGSPEEAAAAVEKGNAPRIIMHLDDLVAQRGDLDDWIMRFLVAVQGMEQRGPGNLRQIMTAQTANGAPKLELLWPKFL